MSPFIALFILILYFGILLMIAWATSRGANTLTFFTADRKAPWPLVAFGMIGASISGVTFISVPGNVGHTDFLYSQVVIGYVIGYIIVASVLMPLYYKLGLISIYEYLRDRFGPITYKTGVAYFMVSRTVGSAMRLFLTAGVLQIFIFSGWGIPFELTVVITLALIWVYTFKGGIKTIIFTDTFQTTFLVGGALICMWQMASQMGNTIEILENTLKSRTWFEFSNYKSPMFFLKQIVGGIFITIAMTGLDQDLMQKNLTCPNIRDAQKNMASFTVILVLVNLIFLTLGALMYDLITYRQIPLPHSPDLVFPTLALHHLGFISALFFFLGITASSYASADSALTALTTSFCVDVLKLQNMDDEKKKSNIKTLVHLGFSVIFIVIILITRQLADRSLIDIILKTAGYTYGPLLGFFFFGILTKRSYNDAWAPLISIAGPIGVALLDFLAPHWLHGYKFGFELLLVNGLITYVLLYLSSFLHAKSQT